MKRHGPWRVLGLDPTDDRAAIRRAYADKLRGLDVDRDIEGYTRLRGARDHALALARSSAVAEVAEVDAREPVLADANLEEAALDGAFAEEEAIGSADALPDPPAELAAPTPPEVLLAVLFPQGEASEEPLTPDELAAAEQALAGILEEARASSIDGQAGIEDWLAHHLASAWPRSAWLVEEAAGAFGWAEEFGQLSERPAVRFLNPRLKGMRFTARVQQADHPLHKAWVELSKPGRKSGFAFRRASKADVRLLLDGIRERYPEVEGHLDPERVGSWEATFEESPWTPWRVVWRIIGVVLFLSIVSSMFTRPTDGIPAAPPEIAWSEHELDDLVVELFGERFDDATLLAEAPDLWERIQNISSRRGNSPDHVDDSTKQMLIFLRGQTQLAARDADFETLLAIKQVKLELLRIVSQQDDSWACLRYAREGLFPANVSVHENLRTRERELAARLAASNLLVPSDSEFPQTATIAGSVIERIMLSTGLSEDAVRDAIRDRGDPSNLCTYRLALLEAVLQRPAEASSDLLRLI